VFIVSDDSVGDGRTVRTLQKLDIQTGAEVWRVTILDTGYYGSETTAPTASGPIRVMLSAVTIRAGMINIECHMAAPAILPLPHRRRGLG